MQSLDRKGLKASTRESYNSALGRHIFPTFGDYRLRDVAPLHVEQFHTDQVTGRPVTQDRPQFAARVAGNFLARSGQRPNRQIADTEEPQARLQTAGEAHLVAEAGPGDHSGRS